MERDVQGALVKEEEVTQRMNVSSPDKRVKSAIRILDIFFIAFDVCFLSSECLSLCHPDHHYH
jgi:hypothetical protein